MVNFGCYGWLFPPIAQWAISAFHFSWFCVHVYNAVLVARDASPRRSLLASPAFYLSCRGARDPETSRDHLLDRTIEFARIFCARSRFSYKSFSAREFCRGESFSSELCSSTSEIEQSSRLLCSRSRGDLSSKGRPTELRAVCCAYVVRWST